MPESSEPVEVGLCDQIAAVVYIVLVDERIVYNNKLCDLLWTCTRRRRTGPRGGIVALWSSRGHQHDGFTRATVPCGQLVLTPVALHYSSVAPCRLGLRSSVESATQNSPVNWGYELGQSVVCTFQCSKPPIRAASPSLCLHAYGRRSTGWAKKRDHTLTTIILSSRNRLKKSFSLEDSLVNLQLNGY